MRWYLILFGFCCCEEGKKNSSKPTWGGKGWLHLPCWVCHQGTWGQEPMPAAWSQELGLWREVTSWLTSFAGLSYFPYTTMDLGMALPTVGLAFPHGLVINRMLQGPQTCSQASLTELMTPQRSFPFSRSLLFVSSWQRLRSTVSIWDFSLGRHGNTLLPAPSAQCFEGRPRIRQSDAALGHGKESLSQRKQKNRSKTKQNFLQYKA